MNQQSTVHASPAEGYARQGGTVTALNPRTILPPCARCRGKMILESEGGDSTCFSCGHVVYAVAPAERATRPILHGGQDIS